MEKKFIYPEIRYDLYKYETKKVLIMETYLRKKHRGKYYLWKCFREIHLDLNIEGMALLQEMQRFYVEVYRNMVLGKVSTNIVDAQFLKPIFELDPDQTPEEERLRLKI